MYDDVLCPFDGSEGATDVLHHVSQIAHWADATVHLLYVADTNRDSVTVVENEVVDALVQEGRDVVAEGAQTLRNLGVDHETDVVQGNPAETIVDYADSHGHDLIVMPTRGKEGLSRYLGGSVSEKVVRLSPVPVLTTRMQADEEFTFPYERILVPTDGSEQATRAVRHALSLAAALDATVHALSAVEETALGLDVRSTVASEESERAAREAVESVADAAADYDVTVETHVERGSPVDVIRDAIESTDSHAVVMGTTGRRGTDRILLGSVAEKTVRTAPVPVITVGGDD
ncbi:universal stress protein [Salinirubrum litoreum]|uniref:Universal stress protein n=1 Tax=Salinirubrum litoreum TaxID=1126234 RepID=A0ABD5R5P6_9EURY|nr:universal stress protein [Salinirubrum litoreum]